MTTEKMTPKERWLATLKREPVDRLPMDYWGTLESSILLIKHFGLSEKDDFQLMQELAFPRDFDAEDPEDPSAKVLEKEALKRLHIDFVLKLENRFIGPTSGFNVDPFGCEYDFVQHAGGFYAECSHHPLAEFESVAEIESEYTWPDPDWWDYSTIARQIEGYQDHPIQVGGSEPFLFYKFLRGDENAFMDMVLRPDICHYILDKLFDLALENTKRMFAEIPHPEDLLLLSYVNEDLGGQKGLMISPAHIEKFLLPKMKKVIDFAHQQGAYVFHHNDGSIRSILPKLIDIGIDILNPIQWRLKDMDREGLQQDFGSQLIFHGAVDNQQTLPFGSPEDVRNEVQENIKILGKDGGYIIASCHNLQGNTPIENILALYQAGYEYGWQ